MMGDDNKNSAVDAWFAQLEHPLKAVMREAREIILQADARMTESIKWSTPTFAYKGNLLSIQPRATKFVSLMFHRGAEIPGDHPYLEGDAALVRTMKFAGRKELEDHRADLEAVVRAWCDWRAAG